MVGSHDQENGLTHEPDENTRLLDTSEDYSAFSIRGEQDDADDSLPQRPSSRRWKLHELRKQIPEPLRTVGSGIAQWVKGPDPPLVLKINPLFPSIQNAPLRFVDRFLPKRKHKILLLLAFYFIWLTTFVGVLHHSIFVGDIEGYGSPRQISCRASYWAGGNGCGIDGNNCRPFSNSTFAFRCPADCRRTQQLNPHAVGDQNAEYRPLVIGGPQSSGHAFDGDGIYRGDSFICASAIHSGFVSNSKGGCGVVRLVGTHDSFPSTKRNGIESLAFDSSFPLSFSFAKGTNSECKDLRWPLLAVSVIFTALISLFTRSPAIFFSSIFIGMYFHVGLASDPPNAGSYYDIISLILGRFLPGCFCAFVFYRYCIRPALTGLEAQIEKTVLWLGMCWVGALTNYTFDFIPIARLTPRDLAQQPGAKAALAIIVTVIWLIVFGQIYALRLAGKLPRYLALYALICGTLLIFVAVPGLNLRIHHYILALLLLPGTALQTRPSLMYQGLLVGFFINGVARWGFDSILQTPAALQGDGQFFSPLPILHAPVAYADNITFSWEPPPRGWEGTSVLVNDVERWRSYEGYDPNEWTFTRRSNDERNYYFRFGLLLGSGAGDYTKAGVWEGDGSWREMEEGPSFA